MYNAKTVCQSLRKLTTLHNTKKTDLAKALGVTYPTIVKWLDGNLKLIEMPEPCLTINKEIFDSFKLSSDKCVCVLANSNYKNIAVGDRLLVT